MPGYLLLAGGGEFGGQMEQPDRQALVLAGGLQTPVRIIPAAAAPDHNDQHAGQNGVRWFTHLGATDILSLPIIDKASADDPLLAAELENARLIYLLGGFPGYLYKSLNGSHAWQAILSAWQAGAVIAGSSAGAMVLCDAFYDPYDSRISPGLGLLPQACVLPHYQDFGRKWAAQLGPQLTEVVLIGIDEQTAMIDDVGDGIWHVYGKGKVTLHQGDQRPTFGPGYPFQFPPGGST